MTKSRQGQSLIQVMIAAVIMGVIMMAFISMQSTQQKATAGAQAKVTRNMLQILMQQTLVDQAALGRSLQDTTHPGNVALKKCLQPTGASCVETTSPQGFILYDASGSPLGGAGGSAPLLYDDNGTPCTTASPKCLFQVFATYSAKCPAISPCASPSVSAIYTIQTVSGVTPIGGTPLKPIVSPSIPIFYNAWASGGGGGGSSNTENQSVPNWPNRVTCTSVAGNSAVLHVAKVQADATFHAGYVKAESGGDSTYIWFDSTGKLILNHNADGTTDALSGCTLGATISNLRPTN